MKKALRALLLLVLVVSLVSACTWGQKPQPSPEVERYREKVTVETAVKVLMQDNGLSDLSKYPDGRPTGAPVRSYSAGEATNDMASFPSAVWHIYYDGKEGYIRLRTMEYYYTVENDGTVRQFGDPAKTVEYNAG
jgi:hypothetical protein